MYHDPMYHFPNAGRAAAMKPKGRRLFAGARRRAA